MNTKELIESAGLNFEWYIDEAKSILRELKKDHPCENYIAEKVRNVQQLFIDEFDERKRQELIKKQNEETKK